MRHNCWSGWIISFIFLQGFNVLAGNPTTTRNKTEKKDLQPIPNKLVVLTFDDSSKSHFTVVRPLLMKYRFNATFFITEGWDFATNKKDYMTWEEIRQLDRDGFEIGNHTRDHLAITDTTEKQLSEQLQGIERRCEEHGIPKPVSFAWPGNARTLKAFDELRKHGILFARRGGEPEYPYKDGEGVAYEPGLDHPYVLPSAGDARPNWELANFIRAVEQAKNGKIAILQFHGVPDTAHDWVSSSSDRFEGYLRYLAMNDYRVIALRDLAKYVDPEQAPDNPQEIIEKRIKERPKSP
jgi:peptidoglycan/xylan/chitin deacetylase (PgdA/CDA1 family)